MDWLSDEANNYLQLALKAGYDEEELVVATAEIAQREQRIVSSGLFANVLNEIRNRKQREIRDH